MTNHKVDILFFKADWEHFSKKMLPKINSLASEFKHFTWKIVDIDSNKDECRSNKINFAPTLVVFKDNIEINRVEGYSLIKPIRSLLKSIKKEDLE